MSFRESVINFHDPGRYSVVSTPSIVSTPSVSRLGATSIMTVGTTGDSPKSEYQVNSFEAGDLYVESCYSSPQGLSTQYPGYLKNFRTV